MIKRQVRYSGGVFAERLDLIGKTVYMLYRPDDIWTLRVFEANGAEIGLLTAHYQWSQTAHTLAMRRQIMKCVRKKKIQVDAETDPVQVYLRHLREEAPRRKKTATKLAAARRVAAKSDPAEFLQDPAPESKRTHSPAENSTPDEGRPQKLNIPPGFSR